MKKLIILCFVLLMGLGSLQLQARSDRPYVPQAPELQLLMNIEEPRPRHCRMADGKVRVEIKNVGEGAVNVWSWNSPVMRDALHFEMLYPDGSPFVIKSAAQLATGLFDKVVPLRVGESYVMELSLTADEWQVALNQISDGTGAVQVRVVYEVKRTDAGTIDHVWQGKIESAVVNTIGVGKKCKK